MRSVKQVLLQWLGVTIDPGDRDLAQNLFGRTWAGQVVTPPEALQLSTVWACVRLISESIATLPLGFYLRKPDGSRKVAGGHPLYALLHSQPNANMAAVTFWEAVVASMLLWGNAYIEVKRASGKVVALNFLMPNRIECKLGDDGLLKYRYTSTSGTWRAIAAADVMHIPAFTVDGMRGLSPVAYGAQVLATARVTDEASAKVFSRGMRASGLIKTKDILKPAQRDHLRASMEKFRGNNDAGATMVLEADMDYMPLSMNPVDAELLQSRAWNVEEMCRWFRVPPFMVGHSEKSTSWGTGIEQQMIGFVTFVLRPWCVRIEQAINRSLLAPAESGRYFAEFALEGLLRGDSAARAAFYGVMIDKGILTRDEVRALENWPAMAGNAGVLTVQSATVPLDGITSATAPAKAADALKQWLAEA